MSDISTQVSGGMWHDVVLSSLITLCRKPALKSAIEVNNKFSDALTVERTAAALLPHG